MQLDLSMGAAVAILGLVTIAVFYRPLSKKISDLSQAGTSGVSFATPAQAQLPQEPGPPSATAPDLNTYEQYMATPRYPEMAARESFLVQKLAELKLPEDKQRTLLIRSLANSLVEGEFRQMAQTIFASQLGLLAALAGSHQSFKEQIARDVYSKAVKDWPAYYRDRPYEAWVSFLESSLLITRRNETISLNQKGADFLKFLIDQRLVQARQG